MIFSFACGPVATNCYLSVDRENRTAFVIDAPQGCLQHILKNLDAEHVSITDILLTHTHWDHIADCAPLRRATSATVWVHPHDAYRLIDPMRHTVWPLPFGIEPVTDFRLLEFDATSEPHIHVGNPEDGIQSTLRALFTPGHTEGGVCYVDDKERCVFVGDTLFLGSVGRTDLPGGDMSVLIESIRNELFALPRDYVVYPGHGPMTSIARERASNPFVGDNIL